MQFPQTHKITAEPALTLEKQGFDLSSTRRQMLLGLALMLLLAFFEYLPSINFHRPGACSAQISNICLLSASALFVSLITLELTGSMGNRLRAVPAIWSGLLFVVYPLHPEPVDCLRGRADLIATVFYAAMIFFLLRYRLLKEKTYFAAGIITGAALVIDLCYRYFDQTLQLPGPAPAQRLAVLDNLNLAQILMPVSSQLKPPAWLAPITMTAFGLACTSGLARTIARSARWKVFAILTLWGVLSILPALLLDRPAQAEHLRHLFIPLSVPLCILIALLSEPGIDALSRRAAISWCLIGTCLQSIVFLCWSYGLQLNLAAWLILRDLLHK